MFDRTTSTLAHVDPEIAAAIAAENRRQEEHIELIASENYASPAVMAAQGSQLTNKYAEGYPGKRYYGGCEFVDVVEQLAIDRVKKLFGAELRERAGQLRLAGQPGGALRPDPARRHDHGDEPRRRRPPDPRHGAQHERQVVQGRELRAHRGRGDRLRRDGAAGPRDQAQADHRRRLGVQPAHRLRALRAGRQGRRRLVHGRHGALRRADRRRHLPEPAAARRTSSRRRRTRACAARAAASS